MRIALKKYEAEHDRFIFEALVATDGNFKEVHRQFNQAFGVEATKAGIYSRVNTIRRIYCQPGEDRSYEHVLSLMPQPIEGQIRYEKPTRNQVKSVGKDNRIYTEEEKLFVVKSLVGNSGNYNATLREVNDHFGTNRKKPNLHQLVNRLIKNTGIHVGDYSGLLRQLESQNTTRKTTNPKQENSRGKESYSPSQMLYTVGLRENTVLTNLEKLANELEEFAEGTALKSKYDNQNIATMLMEGSEEEKRRILAELEKLSHGSPSQAPTIKIITFAGSRNFETSRHLLLPVRFEDAKQTSNNLGSIICDSLGGAFIDSEVYAPSSSHPIKEVYGGMTKLNFRVVGVESPQIIEGIVKTAESQIQTNFRGLKLTIVDDVPLYSEALKSDRIGA